MNDHKSEGGHWYDREGEPRYTIIGTNGKERNTTLRDAKKEGYVPSVTTIIDILDKPSLNTWKINKALEASVNLERLEDETDSSFIYRCKQEYQQIGSTAAIEGTKIHAMIEEGFLNKTTNRTYEVIQEYLDKEFPNETWIAEDSFCSPLGYGGKIDLYSKSGIFVDFKTKDNLEGKEPKSLAFDNYGMQLSAYGQGCGYDSIQRVSIFVDRQQPTLIATHIWDDTHDKHRKMFNSLLDYWKLVKNYDSSFVLDKQ